MKEKSHVEVRTIYRRNFINIVLAVIGIVQGFAFNFLAPQLPGIVSQGWNANQYKVIAHFFLCSVLIMRVFQTYVLGAVEYQRWNIAFLDIFLVFGTGLLQYFIFSTLTPDPNAFSAFAFYRAFLVMALFSFYGYWRTMSIVKKNRFISNPESSNVSAQYFESEMRLQLVNLLGITAMIIISLYVLIPHLYPLPRILIIERLRVDLIYTIAAFTAAAILLLNIVYSLNATFLKPKITIKSIEPDEGKISKSRKPKTEIEIRKAKKSDVEELAVLMSDNFAYVYEALLGEGRNVREIVETLLAQAGGNHELGFKKFHVAVSTKGKVLGLLRTKTMDSGINPKFLVSGFTMAFVLLRKIGVAGLIHALKNSRAVLSASNPVFLSDEFHILYLAVVPEHQENSVGGQLVKFSYDEAQKCRKKCLVAEVREMNKSALTFFANQGFKKDAVIESACDFKLVKGSRFRMVKEVK